MRITGMLVALGACTLVGCKCLFPPAPPPGPPRPATPHKPRVPHEEVYPPKEHPGQPERAKEPVEKPHTQRPYRLTPLSRKYLNGIPLKRTWKYVVIHHSATDVGDMASFDRGHKQRGWLGVGYHFVIGNGSYSNDGEIEVTFRWKRQIHGAHAGVKEYNEHGIGICLVGNFNKSRPSRKQLQSLIALTAYLQGRCGIPMARILGHRDVKSTDCPGRLFPMTQVKETLAKQEAWRGT